MSTAQAVRTTRALWWGWKAEFSGAAEYRLDLVSGTLVSAVWLGLSIAPMLVVAANSATAPGWTLPRLLFLQAVWYLMDGVLWMIIANNAREISSARPKSRWCSVSDRSLLTKRSSTGITNIHTACTLSSSQRARNSSSITRPEGR